ncbi:hypothetical protein GGX14DRAFT_449900 [Mycena pura]|uniref:Uncharacterized protein n=1 Tax=Mycena pura TaxID=153505 RepID=A0AAD6VH91_9AGAR|nr:hypothetical protein GGX14DRAFT_449900 [Mycena pura]
MSRAPTATSWRERPPSPAGPRAHDWKHQQSHKVTAPRQRSGFSGRPVEDGSSHGRHTRSLLHGDATTSSAPGPPRLSRDHTALQSRSHAMAPSNPAPQLRSVVVPETIESHAPVAIPAIDPTVNAALDLDLGLNPNLNLKFNSQEALALDAAEGDIAETEIQRRQLVAPRTSNTEPQETLDAVTKRLNGLIKAQASSPIHPPVGRRRAPAVSRPAQEDKENQSVSEGWSYVAADKYQKGLGLGVHGVDAKMEQEMGNVIFLPKNGPDTKERHEKERKGKLLPPLQPKRSAIPVATSPIALSTATNNPTFTKAGVTTSRLTSPVVGEFKGWFSNLFNWKGQPGTGVVYSSDGFEKTRREVGLLLEKLGILVEGCGFSFAEGTKRAGDDFSTGMVLRCKVEETSADGAYTGVKPVRFRVEFSAAPTARALTYAPPSHRHHSAPLSPNLNTGNLPSKLNALATPFDMPLKQRANVQMGRPSATGLGAVAAFPPGCQTAIVLVHEKGSATTFKNVWKKLKETYGTDAGCAYPMLSPAIGTTPFMEQAQRFAL